MRSGRCIKNQLPSQDGFLKRFRSPGDARGIIAEVAASVCSATNAQILIIGEGDSIIASNVSKVA